MFEKSQIPPLHFSALCDLLETSKKKYGADLGRSRLISAIAGILLKLQEFHFSFFFSTIRVVILKNSDNFFGKDYKREI